jgi:hypothetical protein
LEAHSTAHGMTNKNHLFQLEIIRYCNHVLAQAGICA